MLLYVDYDDDGEDSDIADDCYADELYVCC
jgi:hypothetical protein